MTTKDKLTILDGLYSKGDLPEAENQLSLWIREAGEGGDRAGLLTFYNELEGLFRVTGRSEEACRISEKSLDLITELGLAGTVHHATTLLNAATANRAAGHMEKALLLYRQAADVYRGIGDFPDKSYYQATLYNNIGQVYQQMGDDTSAEKYLRQALEQIQSVPGAESERATTRSNLAQVLSRLGRQEEAGRMIVDSLAYYESEEGNGDNHYTAALSAAGQIACREGAFNKASVYYKKALEISQRVYGETPETRMIRENLDQVYDRMGMKPAEDVKEPV